MSSNNEKLKVQNHKPVELASYVPDVVKRLMLRIRDEQIETVALYGFGDNMKWLYRLLKEQGRKPILCDWREKYIGYDCGDDKLVNVLSLNNRSDVLLVICVEEIHAMKDSMYFLFKNKLDAVPVIYDRTLPHNPFTQEDPYKEIYRRARERAISMIADDQLFDLAQFIRLTKDVPGDVVEFGSLHGGSGAVIVEAVSHFGKKPVWLFDSFEGIPKSRYGMDHRWDGTFSNNSYSEVKNAFSDCEHVKVVKGNICQTHKQVENSISFGYLASDTLETGEVLLNFMWPKLSKGGIICVCDYGSYPNCVPLTMFVDKFFEDKKDAFIYYPNRIGIWIMKK